jgi:hypothetical protein
MEFETIWFDLSSNLQAFYLTECGSIYFTLCPTVKFNKRASWVRQKILKISYSVLNVLF